ncbi:hypothetical protein [Nocardia sp. NPDC060249]|uniref:hypothetical protein n=1 Tax=Nocardia sp. NPDC060249 TaxID=3347082 RepID=UPI0036678B6D
MIVSTCTVCAAAIAWWECPTGGWWSHDEHPADHHDATSSFDPVEDMDAQGVWHTIDPKAQA